LDQLLRTFSRFRGRRQLSCHACKLIRPRRLLDLLGLGSANTSSKVSGQVTRIVRL
jgi:hypothetical protein